MLKERDREHCNKKNGARGVSKEAETPDHMKITMMHALFLVLVTCVLCVFRGSEGSLMPLDGFSAPCEK